MQATLLSRRLLLNVQSASALERVGEHLFIIGDDTPFLYRLDLNGDLVQTLALWDERKSDSVRIPKARKPDLEMMAQIEWQGHHELLIFGSGSRTPERDVCFRVDISDPTDPRLNARISMAPLYDLLRQNPNVTGSGRLNLEGAAVTSDSVLLFQRGNISGVHAVCLWQRDAVMEYLENPIVPPPAPRILTYRLPRHGDLDAGFSGATTIDAQTILFCAAVEDTANEIDDGPPLASYVGAIDLTVGANEPHDPIWLCELGAPDQPFRGKVEGIALIPVAADGANLLCVTDNDLGASEMLRIRLDEEKETPLRSREM